MTTAARSVAAATISFGIVSIPIKLYSTSETSNDVSFHMHHDEDGARLKQQYVCTKCGVVVDRDHTVKGYEHAKGQHVIFTPEELKAMDEVATQRIELEQYIPIEEFEPLYIEKSYYLGPDKGADRSYQTLAMALGGTVAIGRYAAKGREHVVAIRSYRDGLLLHQLRYEAETKPWEAIPPREDVAIDPRNVKLARELVRRSSVAELDLGKFTDRVDMRIRALIAAKVAGGEIVVAQEPGGPPVAPATADALMDQLKASLDVAPPDKRSAPARTRHAAKKKRAA